MFYCQGGFVFAIACSHMVTHASPVVLMMKKEGMFVLHIPDSQILPPQWIDCGKVKREMSTEKETLVQELVG